MYEPFLVAMCGDGCANPLGDQETMTRAVLFTAMLIVLLPVMAIGCGEDRSPQIATDQTDTRHKPEPNEMSDPKSECEDLMNAVLPFAEQMLAKHREFYPFGGTMGVDGEIAHTNAWAGDEHPDSTDVMEMLVQGFREGAQRGEYKATALVYDIRTIPPGKQEKQDAIAIAFDHRDDYSVVVIFPYSFTSKGELAIETAFMTKGENKIFTE